MGIKVIQVYVGLMANKKWWCVILEAGLLIDGVKVIKKTRTKSVHKNVSKRIWIWTWFEIA